MWLGNKLAKTEKKEYRLLAYCFIITLNNISKSEQIVQTYGLLHDDVLIAPVLAFNCRVDSTKYCYAFYLSTYRSLPVFHRLLVLSHFSPYLRLYCLFIWQIRQLYCSFHFLFHFISGLALLFLLSMENELEIKSGSSCILNWVTILAQGWKDCANQRNTSTRTAYVYAQNIKNMKRNCLTWRLM